MQRGREEERGDKHTQKYTTPDLINKEIQNKKVTGQKGKKKRKRKIVKKRKKHAHKHT